jgi:predicted RNA-binding Zn ribbon-like protein
MREWSDKAFIGDNIVLDFLNTGGGDTKARDVERLETFSDVVTWAQAGRIVAEGEDAALADLALQWPVVAEARRAELILHREALYRFVSFSMNGVPVLEADRLAVEDGIRAGFSKARLVPDASGSLTWLVGVGDAGLSVVKFRLDLAAAALLTDPASQTIRQCETCSWLFLDASISNRRRWCSMAVCGNRAKARRHYHRTRPLSI